MKKFKEAYMEALLKQIKEAAIIYQKNFVGKIFLYIFSDNFIEYYLEVLTNFLKKIKRIYNEKK